MIQQTSLAAYDHIQKKLGEKQLKVYLCLEDLESANNTILAKRLGWSINRITPRVKELRDAGCIVVDCMRECPITHRITYFWKVSDIFVPQETKVFKDDKTIYRHIPIFPMELKKEVYSNSI